MHRKGWMMAAAACLAASNGNAGSGNQGGHPAGGSAGTAGASAVGGAGGKGAGGSAYGGGAPGSAGGGGAQVAGGGQGGHAGQSGGAGGRGGVPSSAGGRSGSGGTGGQGGAVTPPADRRLPLPCVAALPTGFCMQSDSGDYIGGGMNYQASGPASVKITEMSSYALGIRLSQPVAGAGPWDIGVGMPPSAVLAPGLYAVLGTIPQDPTSGTLNTSGDGRGCSRVTGQFSVEELTRGPGVGVTRFSVTFEQHCDGATPALRGVINYQATGTPDPTPAPDRVVPLTGKITRLAYDPTANVAFGLDATNMQIGRIDLTTGMTTYAPVAHAPNDGCVDAARGRLFVVNKGSQTITEYATDTLASVRDIPWMSMDRSPTQTRFQIYCTHDRLYAVDGASTPALFTVDGLDGAAPVVTDHSTQLSAVYGLAVNGAGTALYASYQRYQTPMGVYVSRSRLPDLAKLDMSSMNVPNFTAVPASGAPLLLDESRGYVFVMDKIFDATDLTTLLYTLPGTSYSPLSGPEEVASALDAANGLMATKNFVYELARFDPVAATIIPGADQLFFDNAGTLWMLSTAKATLSAQIIRR